MSDQSRPDRTTPPAEPGPVDPAIADGLRLIKAFRLISDPAARTDVIAHAERLAAAAKN